MGRRPQARSRDLRENHFERTPDRPTPHVRIKRRYHLRIFGHRIRPLALVLLVIICSVLYNIILGLYGLTMNYIKLAESEKAIEERSRMKDALELEKENWKSDEFLEEEARKLGLVKPEDLIDPETTQATGE